jgi:ferredoxin-NADP reductase
MAAASGMQGGMDMGKMMEGMMGAGARQEVYPFLMGLPALTPETRAAAQLLSEQRISEGSILLQRAQENLSAAILAGDHVATQQALQQLREGMGTVGSGVAVYKLLREGTPPQDVALQWFKREMGLPTPPTHIGDRSLLDVSYVHLFTMALLLALALAMVSMYFLRMRRAAALFGKLEPAGGAQPPGAAPPLKGEAAPLSPADSPAKPVSAKWRGHLRVSSVIAETPSVKTLRLSPASGGTMPFTFAPGQFLNVSLPIGGARMNRSYSISSSPTQRDYVELTVKREPRGAVSRHLDDLLKVGDLLEVGGPVGRFTFDGTEAESIVLISGGVGITPMMSIARYLTDRSWPGDIFFLYACRAPADFIFAREIGLLQRANPKLHVTVVMERPEGTDWQGPKGRLSTQLLSQAVPDIASRRIHLCGPPVMMDAVKALLAELKVPAEQVKTEDFGTAAPSAGTTGTSARFTSPATGPMVTFSKNQKSSKIHADQTVLELSEELGIGIDFACRVGTCGVCKVKLTAGEVDMAVDDGLDADDKAAGLILACQAKPKGPVSVEA